MSQEEIIEFINDNFPNYHYERTHGNNNVVRFKRDDGIRLVDIWYGRMTVGVYDKGKEQKFFKRVDPDELIDII